MANQEWTELIQAVSSSKLAAPWKPNWIWSQLLQERQKLDRLRNKLQNAQQKNQLKTSRGTQLQTKAIDPTLDSSIVAQQKNQPETSSKTQLQTKVIDPTSDSSIIAQ